jgi:hypothetical protein
MKARVRTFAQRGPAGERADVCLEPSPKLRRTCGGQCPVQDSHRQPAEESLEIPQPAVSPLERSQLQAPAVNSISSTGCLLASLYSREAKITLAHFTSFCSFSKKPLPVAGDASMPFTMAVTSMA